MGTRLLMLCLWIISTLAIAKNLSDQDNRERARKCGINPDTKKYDFPQFKSGPKLEFLSIPISPRHYVVSSKFIPGFNETTCEQNKDFTSKAKDSNIQKKITFIGMCFEERGFLLVEATEKYEWFPCLPTELLGEKTNVRAYSEDNKRHDLKIMDCTYKVGNDKLCLNKEIEKYKELGGPLYQIDGNDTTGKWTIHGTGFWHKSAEINNKIPESVVVPVFLHLKDICDASGICPVSDATTTETPITTTSEEVTTTPVPPEINRPDISSTQKPESHQDTEYEEYEEEEDFFVSADFLNGSGKMGLNLIIAVTVMVLIVLY